MNMKRLHLNKDHKGFVILFTILISAIIMMIGLGIYSIATRETAISGSAREAQYAFYAADAGVECALFAQHLDALNPPGPFNPGGPSFSCGAANPVNVSGAGSPSNPYVFDVLIDAANKTCTHVSVFDVAGSPPSRRVISQGYNLCNAQGIPLTTNPLLVERDLDTQYQIATAPTGP